MFSASSAEYQLSPRRSHYIFLPLFRWKRPNMRVFVYVYVCGWVGGWAGGRALVCVLAELAKRSKFLLIPREGISSLRRILLFRVLWNKASSLPLSLSLPSSRAPSFLALLPPILLPSLPSVHSILAPASTTLSWLSISYHRLSIRSSEL